jgi:signal transduction histidine kinase
VVEAERLSRLVNQVLDMAKIEAGHAEWHNAEVDMCELLEQAAATMGETCRERGVALQLQRPEVVQPLWADADRITQVVLNLLSNAAKYAPRGTGLVQMRLKDSTDGIVVEVQDNGPGIAQEQQAMVFEKFRQVSGNDHYRPGGTGLGLPISRQIVEHFGGRLWLHSSPGQGAVFGFFLPRHGADVECTASTDQPLI